VSTGDNLGASLVIGARVATAAGSPLFPISAARLSTQLITRAMLAEPGHPLEVRAGAGLRATPELALLLREKPVGSASMASVLAATSAIIGVITVSRADGPGLGLDDDNAGSLSQVVLGPAAVAPSRIEDLRLLGCVLRVQGEVVATGAGAAAHGHPAAAAAWLLGELHAGGQDAEPGWLLCTGALTAPVDVTAGLAITAEFDGLGAVDAWSAAQGSSSAAQESSSAAQESSSAAQESRQPPGNKETASVFGV
jgi:2-oxo-3-hexenedioate decarboxylase